MEIQEIEKRLSEIQVELEKSDCDVDALEEEVRALMSEKEERKAQAEKRKSMLDEIANNNDLKVIEQIEEKEERKKMEMTINSKEYRQAFLKNLMGKEMDAEERSAFVATTSNTSAVLPTTMADEIWDKIEAEHAILGDIKIYRTGTILEVPVRTAIAQGDATSVNEASANDDEENTFTNVTLSGKDFSKTVEISYALAEMSIDAFEEYIVDEISERIANAMANDVFTQISTDMASANKLDVATSGTLTWGEVTNAFAQLENAKNIVVYANRKSIYAYLGGMVDDNGRPIFQSSAQEGIEGHLLGAPVKVDDGAGEGKFIIGDAQKVVYNMIKDIMIERDKDIKTHKEIFSGYARGEGKLVFDKAFVELDVTP